MTFQPIGLGTTDNDGLGDKPKAAGQKINANFADLYPAQIAFTTAVPLNAPGGRYLAQTTVSSVVAFTVASGAIAGGNAYARLIADGTNAPTFSGMIEHGSSAGYLNTSGAVNLITFWNDGTVNWFSIAQGVVAVPVGPNVSISAAISQNEGNSGTTAFVYTVTRNVTTGAASVPWSFAAGATTASDFVGGSFPAGGSVALADGVASGTFTVNVQGDTTSEPNEAFTVSIAAPGGYSNGSSMSATGTIVNDDAAATSYFQFANRTNMTESAHSGGGFDYTPTTAPGANYAAPVAVAYSTLKLPATTDGFFAVEQGVRVTSGAIMGLCSTAAPSSFASVLLGLYDDAVVFGANDGTKYNVLVNGAPLTGTPNGGFITVATGDIKRIRRVGTTAYAEVSKDGGATYTITHTLTGITTAALTPFIQSGNSAAISLRPSNSGNFA